MQIWTSHKQLKPFEWKFQMDSVHSNAYSNNSNQILSIWLRILTIRKGFKAFECKFYPFEMDLKHSYANSNPSNEIRSIQMQIQTIR